MELNDLVYKKIVKLSEQGDELADNFKYDKAILKYEQALSGNYKKITLTIMKEVKLIVLNGISKRKIIGKMSGIREGGNKWIMDCLY